MGFACVCSSGPTDVRKTTKRAIAAKPAKPAIAIKSHSRVFITSSPFAHAAGFGVVHAAHAAHIAHSAHGMDRHGDGNIPGLFERQCQRKASPAASGFFRPMSMTW